MDEVVRNGLLVAGTFLVLIITAVGSYGVGKADGIEQARAEDEEPEA